MSPSSSRWRAQEAPDRVRLPRGRLHEFLQRNAAGPFQQIEDLCRFAAAVGRTVGFLRASGLSGRLGLDGAAFALRFRARAFVVGGSGFVLVFFGIEVSFWWFSFERQSPRHDINHSVWSRNQVIS